MKKNASFFFLVAVLFILALFTNLSATDGGVPANRRDGDASAGLSAENKLSPEAVDLFRTPLEARLKSSEWVSLAKTPTHIHRVPARVTSSSK